MNEITCLKFPRDVEQALRKVPNIERVMLKDVMGPLLRLSDDQILNHKALPADCQLRMTALMLRRTYTLQETEEENQEVMQLLLAAARACPPYRYRGRRS
jgi:hypothetical protein